MFFPKALRCFAYLMVSSSAPCASPTACAAIPMRPPSSALSAIFNPCPSSPRRFSTGTMQSFSKISTDGDERWPILSSCRPTRKPEKLGSTRKALMPLPPAPGSVFAKTISTPAALPFVTQVLVPFSKYISPDLGVGTLAPTFPPPLDPALAALGVGPAGPTPLPPKPALAAEELLFSPLLTRRAVACIPAASEPAAGSVRQNAPSVSPVAMRRKYFFFCASVPNSSSGACTAEFVTPSAVDIAVKTRATSSSISTYETVSSPGPPHSSGTSIPQQPISPSFLMASAGNFSAFSHSLTNGRTSASMNWRTVSRINFWWSLSEKSIVSSAASRPHLRQHAGYARC